MRGAAQYSTECKYLTAFIEIAGRRVIKYKHDVFIPGFYGKSLSFITWDTQTGEIVGENNAFRVVMLLAAQEEKD